MRPIENTFFQDTIQVLQVFASALGHFDIFMIKIYIPYCDTPSFYSFHKGLYYYFPFNL